MSELGVSAINRAEIERTVRETDPSALLISPRILRRVIKRDRGMTFLGLQVPHHDSYVISGEALRAMVGPEEVGLPPGAAWPETVILLARHDPESLAETAREAVLVDTWRMLFHARVHAAVGRRVAAGELTGAGLRDRIRRIGKAEFDEIRAVLGRDGHLLPPRDDGSVYVEFAAVYLELRLFAPILLPHTFPAIEDGAAIEAVLAEDVDAEALFHASRLAGAPDPLVWSSLQVESETTEAPADEAREVPLKGLYQWLVHRAETVGAAGNVVRAAILRTRAARLAGPHRAEAARAGLRADLDRLAARLQPALDFDDAEAELWRQALPALIDRSARGFWTPEARLLYDLQKVCVDHEREVFTVDLIGWAVSAGRRPLKHLLPHLREVMISSHLRNASRRLRAAQLSGDDRVRLAALLLPAVDRAEEALRDEFRPLIDATLEATGFTPSNLPEQVARRKLVEDLLDRIVEQGFLTIGDLRDACSRSHLKLPDLAGPIEFWRGDRLLRTDRALARSLDGVHRPGEIYLRWLQRLSALAFGTRVGRFLTKYVILPYGGSFIAMEGMQHLVNPAARLLTGFDLRIHFAGPITVGILGTVALGLIDFPEFRHRFLATLRQMGRDVRSVIIGVPGWVLAHPLLHKVLSSRAVRLLWRFVVKPLLVATPIGLLARLSGLQYRSTMLASALVFLASCLLLNSRLGRDFEERLVDELIRSWRHVGHNLLPGLFRLIMSTFNRVLETIDRLLYAVDEWLRFRVGQPTWSLVAKGLMGAVWFFVAYLLRIYVNLLIEPQINPIKHFPVVTVSHKIMLPFALKLTRLLAAVMMPLGPVAANFLAGTTVILLPGVFGFLVWELKENWRLYEANRPRTLPPVVFGGHGETMVQLLRPGLHSGTLPKLFTKLRKSERRVMRGGPENASFKQREMLHHVKEEVRKFIDRDFLALVRASQTLGPARIALGSVAVSTNRVRIELRSPIDAESSLWLAFEEQAGWLVAVVERPGWLSGLSETQRRGLSTAIAGLDKMSGVDLARVGEGRQVPFEHLVVTWRRWVEAWERDQAGRGHPEPLIKELDLLPQ